MKLFYIVLTICLSLTISHRPVLAQTTSSHLEKYIVKEMKKAHLPGLAVGIVKEGEVMLLKGYGQAAGKQIHSETPFILGSTTKSFTAMAMMKLVEQGKIRLDESVITYLPSEHFPENITVRHLLNQTSGISKEAYNEKKGWKIRAPQIGNTFEYSNENYRLLGNMIEKVSGVSYEEFVQVNILTPLQMKNSYTSITLAKQHGLAAGYRSWFGITMENELPYNKDYLAAGYLISSAKDMTHYLITQLQKGEFQNQTIVSSSSIEEMHKPTAKAPMMGESSSYGMGWFHTETNDVKTLRHSGEVPNYHSTMILLPEEGYGIILLTNVNNPLVSSALMEKMGDGIVNLLVGKEPVATPENIYEKTYLLMNGIILAILVLLWINVRRIGKWNKIKQPTILQYILLGLIHFIIPALILTQLPTELGFTWGFLYDFVPDATIVVLMVSVTLLLVGVVKSVLLFTNNRKTTKAKMTV